MLFINVLVTAEVFYFASLISVLSAWGGTCKIGEFRCQNGQCISRESVCDSIRNCPSGIDEYVCTPKFRRGLCGYHRMSSRNKLQLGDLGQNVISYLLGKGPKRPGIFQCQFGGCIPLSRLCDGNVNCIDGSDEGEICESNSCLPGQFRCKYGACIPDWQMCNGRINCPDGSDETPESCKHIKCKNTEFRCRYGGCIPKTRICDIKKHCADGSDEYDFLCMITRAKQVERWRTEGKRLNMEQEKMFLDLAERVAKERKLQEQKEQQQRRQQELGPAPNPKAEVNDSNDDEKDEDFEKDDKSVESPETATSMSVKKSKQLPLAPNSADNVKSTSSPRISTTTRPTTTTSTPKLSVRPATNPDSTKECELPKIPENAIGLIRVCETSPNEYFCKDASKTVPTGVAVHYECNAGYLLFGATAITCKADGTWSSKPPDCEPLIDVRFGYGSALPNNFDPRCPPLQPPKGTKVECIDPKDISVKSCSEKQSIGTEARFMCKPYQRSSGDLPTHYEKCSENGEWVPGTYKTQFSCVPDCGLSEAPKTPYIVNGVSAKRGQWPWHVAIYFKQDGEFKFLCGGALITEHAVLTSAHCVTLRGYPRDPSEFLVFLGKQNIDLPETDSFVQRRLVSKIIVADAFNYITLDSDVAIMALQEQAYLSFYVRPVCYPQTSNSFLEEYQLAPGSLGTVVGFGFTEEGTLAKQLKMTQLPVVSASECASSHGDLFASMSRSTNYCAGFKNGTQVCNGDSGGGQYFKATVKGSARWYIQGLVSYGVPDSKPGTCSSSQYAIFTRVGRYGDWIVRTLSRENLI